MGKKRYYCDFCDKSFADNPQTRKNHNHGLQHCTAKRAHYAQFRGPEEILADDAGKQKCHRFMTTGQCMYGDGCRYSHITPQHQHYLWQLINSKVQNLNNGPPPRLQDWLQKHGLHIHQPLEMTDNNEPITNQTDGQPTLPDCLKGFEVLPPSLLPSRYLTNHDNVPPDWG